MKRKGILNKNHILCIIILSMLISSLHFTTFADDTGSSIPTLFINDRAYGKYDIFPPVYFEEEYYLPLDLFSEFSYLRIDQQGNGSFLIENDHDSSYISFSIEKDDEVISGGRRYAVRVLKRYNSYYLPAVFASSVFSLSFETFEYKSKTLLRLKDPLATMNFATLVDTFAPSEIPTPPQPPFVDPNKESNVAITFENFKGDHTDDILKACRDTHIKAGFFISPSEIINNSTVIRKVITHGHTIGLYIDLDKYSTIDEIDDAISKSIKNFVLVTKIKPHIIRFSQKLNDRTVDEDKLNEIKSKYALTEIMYNINSQDNIYNSSAVIQKLQSEISRFDIAIIKFTSTDSTANSIRSLMEFINKNDGLAIFAPNETTEYIHNF